MLGLRCKDIENLLRLAEIFDMDDVHFGLVVITEPGDASGRHSGHPATVTGTVLVSQRR